MNDNQFVVSDKREQRRSIRLTGERDEASGATVFDLAEANIIHFSNKNFLELGSNFRITNSDFQTLGNITTKDSKRKRNKWFEKSDLSEIWIERMDEKYDGEDVIFEGDIIVIGESEIDKVSKSK